MRAVLVALVGVTVASATMARAEQSPDSTTQQADALARAATSHFRLNEFDAALKAYKEAYRISPKPELLYDIGQCYRKLDQKQAAVDSFRNFLQESDDEDQKASVHALVDKLEAAIREESAARNAPPQGPLVPSPASPVKPVLGRMRVASVPAGAAVRFDDDDRSRTGTTPVEFDDLAPGTRRVFITRDGFDTIERNVDIAAGGTVVVDVQLTQAGAADAAATRAAPVDRPGADKPVYKKWWFWTAVGGLALVGAGVGLAVGLSQGPAAPHANTAAGTFRF